MRDAAVRLTGLDPGLDPKPRARTRSWGSLPAPARLYIAVAIAAAVVVLGLALRSSIDLLTVSAVAGIAALTSSLRLPLPKMKAGATLSVSFIVTFASLLALGPNATALVAVAGALSQSVLGPRGSSQLYRALFNVACLVLTAHVTSAAWSTFGGVAGDLTWPQALPPLVGATSVYFLANTGMVALTIALCTSRPVGRVWQESFLGTSPSYFIGAAIATAIAEALMRGHWEFIPAVGAPAGLTLWAYKVHTEASLALQRSEERYALAASGANDGLWDWDLTTGQIHLSARWRSMVGMGGDASVGRPQEWLDRVHADDRTALTAALEAHVAGETDYFEHEHRILHSDGAYRWVLCRGAAVRGADGRASRIAGSLTDVTERKRAQESLRRAAMHDALTGLPNRALFVELVREALERGQQSPDARSAVLFLDLDHFKTVNDTLGHFIGDELLIVTSKRLQSCLRESDTLARLGGDEFTILLPDLKSVEEATLIATRIQRAVQSPLCLGGRDVFVSASIGIAMSTGDHADPVVIMRDADAAMYRAKAAGKARHELFDDEMHAQALERLALENDLRVAVEHGGAHGGLSLAYQPIVNVTTREVVGVEALARWTRGGHDVPPSVFIPLAEAIGVMDQLGSWVLRTACREFVALRRTRPEGHLSSVAVNVSGVQLTQPSYVSAVLGALRESALPPSALRLEITEAAFLKSPEIVTSVLLDLRTAGVGICLDDFGAGSSSLGRLHQVPFDALKIDRSVIASVADVDRPAMVESVLALARMLGADVIAEGVETEAQLLALERLGCGHAQGFVLSKPVPVSELDACLANPQSRIANGLAGSPAGDLEHGLAGGQDGSAGGLVLH
jgi:diguanylate cyclase (GGDEF)-like protein/PAS domain S-box-containing protein